MPGSVMPHQRSDESAHIILTRNGVPTVIYFIVDIMQTTIQTRISSTAPRCYLADRLLDIFALNRIPSQQGRGSPPPNDPRFATRPPLP